MANDVTFPFGQYRRQSNVDYVKEVLPRISDSNIRNYTNGSSDSEGIVFIDKIIDFGSVLDKTKNYLLKVDIERLETTQRFNIYLQNTSNIDDISLASQYLGYYEIPPIMTSSNENSSLLLVFNARDDYQYLVFELERTIKDDYRLYVQTDGTTRVGRTPEVHPTYLGYFENINTTGKSLVKIGIQANPGMLFCIDGLSIRIGPSGIYEINNGYEVNFISAAVDQSDSLTGLGFYDYEYFTIDYRYKNI